MRENTAKKRMLAGQPALGAAVGFGAPLAAELFSLAGFDFVLVDNQHGVWDDNSTMLAFHQTCLGPAIPMARVKQNDFGAIGRLLDRGALGIVVPLVNTEEDARAAVYAAYYPPMGGRSKGGVSFRLHGEDYMAKANEETFLAVQIESITAVENAEAILGVEGVDGCWVGPADLAATMGIGLDTPRERQQHEDAIMRVLAACNKTGKIPGIASGVNTQYWIDKGFLFVTPGSDIGYMMGAGAETLKSLGR